MVCVMVLEYKPIHLMACYGYLAVIKHALKVGITFNECIHRFPILETEFKVFSVHGEKSKK